MYIHINVYKQTNYKQTNTPSANEGEAGLSCRHVQEYEYKDVHIYI